MVLLHKCYIFCMVVVTYVSITSAFFWGSRPEPPKNYHGQWPVTAYYQQRLVQQPPYGNGENVQIPAIPIQVPLQAQLSPASNIHNVQLVPCLCPVSQDYDFEKDNSGSVFMNQIKQQQQQKP